MVALKTKLKISIVTVFFIIVFLILCYHVILKFDLFWKNEYRARDKSRIYLDTFTKKIFERFLQCPKFEAFNGEKLIHLDLKGAPPTLSYYKQFFPFLRKLGVTGVVMEYEDMFYYKGELEGIRALNAYQLSTIKSILELAEANNLTVIPLIQTFGHFEFVLKLDEFKDLREVSTSPQVLCPTNERAWTVIKEMIDQILEAHPKSKYIHVGCDEVFHLGKCDRCKEVMDKNDWVTQELFVSHVKKIAVYIKSTYPGVQPIIWGDMIGSLSETFLKNSQISSLVDLMIWEYTPKVSGYITDEMLRKYARVFKTIWIASAFKGATGANQKITDVALHLENHIAWMEIVSKWKHLMNFKGIVITGWQRYDHFAVLCELLPVGIPSLTMCMKCLNGCEKGTNGRDVLNILECEPPFSFSPYSFEYSDAVGSSVQFRCQFPGFEVYKLVNKFYSLSTKIKNDLPSDNGWFSVYAALHKFSNPSYVKYTFDKGQVGVHREELKKLEEDLKDALSEVYDVYTVEEWITSFVAPVRIRLEAFWIAMEGILEQNVWPRRPLLNNSDGLERAAKEICTSDRKFGCALLLT